MTIIRGILVDQMRLVVLLQMLVELHLAEDPIKAKPTFEEVSLSGDQNLFLWRKLEQKLDS